MIGEKPLLLLVEDDQLVSLAIEEMLAQAGFSFVAVSSGDAAVIELETDNSRFRAVITDVRMPGSATGWDVAKRARELSPTIPVIYMTGDSAASWAANGVPNSVLLQKPFADPQLITAISSLLNQSDQTNASR